MPTPSTRPRAALSWARTRSCLTAAGAPLHSPSKKPGTNPTAITRFASTCQGRSTSFHICGGARCRFVFSRSGTRRRSTAMLNCKIHRCLGNRPPDFGLVGGVDSVAPSHPKRRMARHRGKDMQPKTRFMIQVPGGTNIGCDTAEQVLDALNDLKNAEGVTVADLQTGMI